MGQQNYSMEALHSIRHMNGYIAEITKEPVPYERIQVLKIRLLNVKDIAKSMYEDAYSLIGKLEGEMAYSFEYIWKHDIDSLRIFSNGSSSSFGDYSEERLHAIRHFEEYLDKFEKGTLKQKEIEKMKLRLMTVRTFATHLFFDAENLIKALDDQ